MIRVRFFGIYDHGRDVLIGSRIGTGETVDDAWHNLIAELGGTLDGYQDEYTYDDWKAA